MTLLRINPTVNYVHSFFYKFFLIFQWLRRSWTDTNYGRYLNVSGNALIGTDSLSFTNGYIHIFNDLSGVYDGYFVNTGEATGTVLGLSILNIRFELFDQDQTIFSDDSLPTDFAFTSGIDTGWRLIRDTSNPTGPYTVASFSNSSDGEFFSLSEVAAVPLPASAWLFGSALVGLTGMRFRRS
ncbi:MAG: VPLPA-CTERM sorting domain-containing protein [Pseudomonadales bacterium]